MKIEKVSFLNSVRSFFSAKRFQNYTNVASCDVFKSDIKSSEMLSTSFLASDIQLQIDMRFFRLLTEAPRATLLTHKERESLIP